MLEGAVDSQFGIGNQTWDSTGFRGYDAGANLKSMSGWFGGGTDLFGFSGLAGGFRSYGGFFTYLGDYGYWWSSMEYGISDARTNGLIATFSEAYRFESSKKSGFNIRCLRDN